MDESVPGLFPRRVGERLAEARAAQKLDLNDICARSRVPVRHLEAIEQGRYDALPAIPYAAGFVRTYAQILGLDGNALSRDFRVEMDARETPGYTAPFEPADPARIPSRLLAIVALLIALVIAGGYAVWRSGALSGDGAEDRARLAAGSSAAPVPVAASRTRVPVSPAPPSAAGGPVTLTAVGPIWLRVSDGDAPKLLEKVLAPGESWTVPATAQHPTLLTGRPEALQVRVGTTQIPPLGLPDHRISGVSLTPQALLARLSAPAPAPGNAPNAAAPALGNRSGAPAP